MNSIRILHLEDEEADSRLIEASLNRHGIESDFRRVDDMDSFREALESFKPDLILSDFELNGFTGEEALAWVRKRRPGIPFLFVSGKIGEDHAIETLRQGAVDYIMKGALSRLPSAVERALMDSRVRTEKEKADEELRQSQARLATLLENSPDSIWSVDPQFRFTAFNSAALSSIKAFGAHRDLRLNDSIQEIFPEDLAWQWRTWIERALQGEVFRMDLAYSESGEEKHFEVSLNPIRSGEARNGVVVLSRDITERKAAEKELRRRSEELERANARLLERRARPETDGREPESPASLGDSASRLKAIIESIPTALVMVDRKGTIVLVNREAQTMFGYPRDKFLGLSIESLVPQRYRAGHPGMRKGYYGNPGARPMGAGRDLYALRQDGSEFPVEIGLNPIETEAGSFVLSAIVDITERKRMEAALRGMNEELEKRVQERTSDLERANAAMERSNIELKQFAYIASHDLQAPLRGISGFVQLLKQDYGGKLDERADEWIRRTVDSAQYMQTLIRDLLSYSRVDAKARPFEETDCGKALEEAVAMLEPSIRESGGRVTRDMLPTVIGDRPQLVQLFQNLVSNGIKYHGDKPPHVHVSAQRTEGAWALSVKDNGIGIAPKHHGRIFEIFQRLHTRQAYPGTGIGLSICRRVVERHGGAITVESEAGQGATFRFTIPDRKAEDK